MFQQGQRQECSTERLTAVKAICYNSSLDTRHWWPVRLAYCSTSRLNRMTQSTPTVTIHSTASQMSVVLARLTTCLVHAGYAFLQTFHSTGHSDIEVFDQHQQLLVHCTIRETETDTRVPVPSVLPALETIAPDLVPLIHDLVQACTVPAEH